MIIYVYRGTEIASPRPRQGQAKAAPRCYTEKTDYRRPQRVPPELILEVLGAILVEFWDCIVQLVIFMSFFSSFKKFAADFQRFQSPRTSIFAIPYSKFEGFCILQQIAS